MTELPKPFGPKWRDRQDTHTGTMEPCCICGKRMKPGLRIMHVHVNAATGEIVPKGVEVESASDGGWYPIGSDCAKKVPSDYIDYIDVTLR